MVNWKTWALLFVALLLGSATAFGIKSIFFVEKETAEDDGSQLIGTVERVLVASGAIQAGTELTAQNVRFVRMPENDVPRDSIISFDGISGRIASQDIADGEEISLFKLEPPSEESEAKAAFVPPGYSVVPIEIGNVSRENGNRNYLRAMKLDHIVRAGDIVDISVVREAVGAGNTRRLVTEPIASGVEVFSVEDENRFGSDGLTRHSSISALLSSEQVESVRRACEAGRLRISLKNDSEDASEPFDADPVGQDSRSANSAFALPNLISGAPARQSEPKNDPDAEARQLVNTNEGFIISAPEEDEADELPGVAAEPAQDDGFTGEYTLAPASVQDDGAQGGFRLDNELPVADDVADELESAPGLELPAELAAPEPVETPVLNDAGLAESLDPVELPDALDATADFEELGVLDDPAEEQDALTDGALFRPRPDEPEAPNGYSASPTRPQATEPATGTNLDAGAGTNAATAPSTGKVYKKTSPFPTVKPRSASSKSVRTSRSARSARTSE